MNILKLLIRKDFKLDRRTQCRLEKRNIEMTKLRSEIRNITNCAEIQMLIREAL